MTTQERNKLFDIRCRSKKGEKLSKEEIVFFKNMFELYPNEYAQDEDRIFEETKPFGSM